jgi:hypothetical protein
VAAGPDPVRATQRISAPPPPRRARQ